MSTIVKVVRWADNTAELRKNLEQGLDQIEAVTASADKLAKSLGGQNVIQSAHNHAAAIEKIGGAARLTAGNKERVNKIVAKAIEQYQVMGRTAPAAMLELEQATRKVETATGGGSGSTGGGLLGKIGLLRGAFIGLGVANVARQSLDTAARLTDMSIATGLSVRELGRLQVVGSLTGVAFGDITKGAAKLQDGIAGSDTSVVRAVRRLGLDFDLLKRQSPGQMFETVANAIGAVENPAMRTHWAIEMFGRGGVALMPLLRAEISKVADEAERTGQVMSDEMVAALDQASDRVDKFKNQVMVLVGKPLSILSTLIDYLSTGWTNVALGADLAASAISRLYRVFLAAPEMPTLPGTPAGILPAKLELPPMPDLEALSRQVRDQVTALDRAEKAAEQYRQKIRGLADEFSGNALANDVREVNAAIVLMQKDGPLSAAEIGRLADRAAELSGKGATLEGTLLELWIAQAKWRDGMPRVEQGLDGILKRATDVTKMLGNGGVLGGIRSIIEIGRGPIVFGVKVEISEPVRVKKWTDGLAELARSLEILADQSGDTFGGILLQLANIIDATNKAADAAADYATARTWTERASALTRGGAAVLQATGSGSTASRVVGGAMSGAAIGGVFGPMGAGIGAAVGGGLGLLRGLFGGSSAAKEAARQANTELAALRSQLSKAHGGFDRLTRMANVLGVDMAAAFRLQGEAGLRAMQAAAAEFEEKQQRLQSALERYGLTWMELGDQARQAHLDQVAEDLIADFEILQTAGADVTRIVDGMSGSINQFLTDALRTGAAIPPAMQPMIEQLIRSGQLTEQNAALLLGLQHEAVPAWDDIKAAAERYGIALDSMGPKIEQIRISEAAAQIVKDWEFLIGAGADAGAVMAGMADEVQELVKSALTFGLELPAAMKPMLEQMVAAGLLTDATGGKLEDLSGIKFAEPLSESVDRLIEALDRLVSSLNGDVNNALDNVARDRTFVVKGRVEFDPQTQLPGGSAGVDTAHSGGVAMMTGIQKHHQGTARILKFHSGVANLASDEVPAILQVGESVLNRRATQEIGPAAIRAMNGGRGGGAGVTRVEMRTGMLEEQLAGLRQDMRDQADKTYRAIRDAFQQGAA